MALLLIYGAIIPKIIKTIYYKFDDYEDDLQTLTETVLGIQDEIDKRDIKHEFG